tara:strand:+ start:61 stop:393 length:333 start_codon:yes stop_codon:yes gene_type:complete
MRPWNQGPFNNQGYNVVYNSSRRNSTISIKDRRGHAAMIEAFKRKKLIVTINKPIVTKPIVNYNKPKPKPIYTPKPNFNSKPSYNSRPSYNSKPSTNSTLVVKRGGKKGN